MLASEYSSKWSWLVGLFLLLPVVAGSQHAAPPNTKEQNVLLLLAGNAGRPSIGRIAQSAQEEMMVKGGSEIHLQLASTDPIAERNPRLSEIEKDWFRTRYAGVHFNLIVTTDGSTLVRVSQLRDEMWPGTPIVFCCTNKGVLVSHPSSRTTGVSVDLDWRGNFRLARQLFPSTQHVALVGGATEEDHRLNDPLAQVIRQNDSSMDFIDLTNLPLSEQLDRVRVLPPNTVIMFGLLVGDVSGNISTPIPGGFQAKLAHVANAPIFFTLNTPGPTGGLGGYMAETVELGKEGGRSWTFRPLRQDAARRCAIAITGDSSASRLGADTALEDPRITYSQRCSD